MKNKEKNTCGQAFIQWLASSGASLNPLSRRKSHALFTAKNAVPMLVGRERASTFDDASFLFEPAFGGIRAFAYLSPGESTLVGNHGLHLSIWFPEFSALHKQVKAQCILDGEIVLFNSGQPDARGYAKRLSLKDPAVIAKSARAVPAIFVASDIVFNDKHQVTDLPLTDRKELLEITVAENKIITLARYLRGQGKMLYNAARRKNLDGIVAKHKNSRYHFGFKSPDWIAVKSSLHDNYIICGYAQGGGVRRLFLGQYDPMGIIIYRGSVPLASAGKSLEEDYAAVTRQKQLPAHPFAQPPPEIPRNATWIAPALVCNVAFSARNERGEFENPIYMGLKLDASWEETVMQDQGGLHSEPDMSGWIMGPWS